jgi:large subunit ribosomal protein L21
MHVEPGSRVELHDVLLLTDGDKITVGSPTVDDAVVVAEVVQHGKGPKVFNFKYKAKVRYRRKRGHRQGYTRLSVTEIRLGAAPAEAPAAATTRRRPARAAATTEEATPEAPAAEAPAEEAPATPARRRRTTAPTQE